MAHIYVYSPSGAVQDRHAFHRGIRRLRALGHEVEVDRDALARSQRFAGTDEMRLAAIGRAAASNADIAMISRGGYGISTILSRMPWSEIEAACDRGTRFLGFSDFTALQLGLLVRSSPRITWAGPALCETFGQSTSSSGEESEIDLVTQQCFEDLVARRSEGTGWRLRAADQRHLDPQNTTIAMDATLWGGNLAMLASLVGTPWMPSITGGVLFLEDVGEHPYRIERMLLQLQHAGILPAQQAIVLGQFTGFRLSSHDRGYNLKRVIDRLRTRISVPILTGLPFGHVARKVLLPVGARVDLLVENREVLLLWGHLP